MKINNQTNEQIQFICTLSLQKQTRLYKKYSILTGRTFRRTRLIWGNLPADGWGRGDGGGGWQETIPLLKILGPITDNASAQTDAHLQTRFVSCYGQSHWNHIGVTMEARGAGTDDGCPRGLDRSFGRIYRHAPMRGGIILQTKIKTQRTVANLRSEAVAAAAQSRF